MLSAFIASIGYAGGVAIDKILICRDKFAVKHFIPLLFVFLALITAILLPAFGVINWGIIDLKYVLLFGLMIVVACTWNVFYYRGIQRQSLHEFEFIMLLTPLFTIFFAAVFLPAERTLGIFVAALIASGAFMYSRLKSHHFHVTMTARNTIIAMILIAFESILIKVLLNVFSPVTLYFTRTLVIAIGFYFMYKPKIFETEDRFVGLTFISAIFGVIGMVLKYYGFKELGIVETTMVLLLGPFLVQGFSYFYFNERNYYRKDIACALVVVGCIVYTIVVTH